MIVGPGLKIFELRLMRSAREECQDTYLRALATIPPVTVHLGHFLTSTMRKPLARRSTSRRTVEVVKTEEKDSDVNLATYLLVDAFRRDCEAQVVITNDSDLPEPIMMDNAGVFSKPASW